MRCLDKILIVDDHPTNVAILEEELGDNYALSTALSGEAALRQVIEFQPDLMLLDIMMPGMDGLTVLSALRQTYSASALPIIMVTAKHDSTEIVKVLNMGANDYITKPIDFPVALARIRIQLSRKRAEDALRLSYERYELAMRGANDGLWDWNLLSNEVYFAPRWAAMFGWEENNIAACLDEWFNRVHPEDLDDLKAAIADHVKGVTPHFEHEHRMMHRDGTHRWILGRGLALRDGDGRAYRMAGSLTDMTERRMVDALTGMPNRLLFLDRLGQAIELAKRRPDYLFAVFLLNLDRFKVVNESLGPAIGDQLLSRAAQRLEQCLRASHTVGRRGAARSATTARLGGDEFGILLRDISDVSDTMRVANRLQEELSTSFQIDAHEVFTTASIGVALSTTGYDQPENFLRDAEIALHRAKARGGACCEVFDVNMHTRAVARLKMETELRQAIEKQEFCLYYQPIVFLTTGAIEGFEALVRWQHPERGLISPADFIPVAEETGQILSIGAWVLQEACRCMSNWQSKFSSNPPLFVSVNLSPRQFEQADLVEQIGNILRNSGLPPQSLKLEITESMLMDNVTSIVHQLEQLRAMGMQVSLDDFGTGYSSLSYLHRFPIDYLKIDRSFVSRLDADSKDVEITKAIVTLAHNLRMQVVAEGIETSEQLLHLKMTGCEYGQGYYISKPVAAEVAETLIDTVHV
ncbi:MAG: EAL domain-containing protein [bacterium]|nr:EAL domain-containing protein [bacterium]